MTGRLLLLATLVGACTESSTVPAPIPGPPDDASVDASFANVDAGDSGNEDSTGVTGSDVDASASSSSGPGVFPDGGAALDAGALDGALRDGRVLVDAGAATGDPEASMTAEDAAVIMGTGAMFEPRRVALLVGCDNYGAGVPALSGSRQSLISMSELLREQGFEVWVRYDQGGTLADAEVFSTGPVMPCTLSQLNADLETLSRDLQAGDEFFFYFGGHGTYSTRSASARSEMDGRDELLVLADYAGERPSYLYDNQLVDKLGAFVDGVQQLAVIDACYSGGFVDDFAASAISILTAAGPYEYSWEGTAPGIGQPADPNAILPFGTYGFFSYYFMAGLLSGRADADQDRGADGAELFAYSADEIVAITLPPYPEIDPQHPQAGGASEGFSFELEADRCGDNVCHGAETATSCASDCRPVCGDAYCDQDANEVCNYDCWW